MLLKQESVSATDVMFRLAPRMNAAGRLNSAMKVVGLFLETDYFLLRTLTDELARDNAARQELCEKAVERAKAQLAGTDFNDVGIIILKNKDWEPGILGIACARLVEEFKRPTILFANTDDGELRGSARSIAQVNIFETLCSLSEYFTGFGGHAQAAGISMDESKFDDFVKAANELILSTHDKHDFTHEISCEMELPIDMDFLSFAKELELMEPTGYQNPRATFLVKGQGLRFDRIGFSQHVKYVSPNVELMGFSKFAPCLMAKTGKVDFELSLGINAFQNRESAQGIIQTLQFEDIEIDEDEAKCMNLHQLSCEGSANLQKTDFKCVDEWLKEPFGTAIVCFSRQEYDEICAQNESVKALPVLIATPRCLNPENCVVVCPAECFDFSFYNRVVVCGRPLCEGYLAKLQKESKALYALGDCSEKKMSVSKDVLRKVYKEIVNVARRTPKLASPHKAYIAVCSGYKVPESIFMLALRIFDEVGTVKINEKGFVQISAKSVNLEDSIAYRNTEHA